MHPILGRGSSALFDRLSIHVKIFPYYYCFEVGRARIFVYQSSPIRR